MKSKRNKEEIRGRPPDEKARNNKEPPKPISTKRLAINLMIKIAAIALAVWLVLAFAIGITINYGNNMHPAVNDGDLVITLKLQRPYLNAAVLYRHDGKTRTGRVVGLPGNVIDISGKGELLVNGAIASEDVYYPTKKAENSKVTYPYTVEEGKAFILNDYREDTDDSRAFGAIDLSEIDGPLILSLRRRGF
ncbi:signal peptidase I [Ruminococcus sp.]|uniref:signal peptidase I n=1 Tax=Ruminococcus sp. TaxID=41978 RepID=UPI002E75A0EA|nr:signal peptidase I [Ruminococcus sp.]MEE1264609.1 signal peptidase I [Ruminococcus sp.]